MKLKPYKNGYHFYCPGCGSAHGFGTAPGGWQFDGNMEKPTVTPSLLTTNPGRPDYRCHLYLIAGQLHYLNDCSHSLVGQVVDLPEWPYEERG